MRDLTRYRTTTIRERNREAQRLEKVLEDACVKLSAVATDILGVSGRLLMQALIDGERDPQVLAVWPNRSCGSNNMCQCTVLQVGIDRLDIMQTSAHRLS